MARAFYVRSSGKKIGPLDKDQIKKRLLSGTIRPEDTVWAEGMDKWYPLRKVNLFQAVAPKNPSSPDLMVLPSPPRARPPLPPPLPGKDSHPSAPANTPELSKNDMKSKKASHSECEQSRSNRSMGARSGKRNKTKGRGGFKILASVLGGLAAVLVLAAGCFFGPAMMGSGSDLPYQGFADHMARERKAEWDRATASSRAFQELTEQMVDDMEKLLDAGRAGKGLGSMPIKLDTPLKAFKTHAKGGKQKALVREDAEAFHAKLVTQGNQFFSSRQAPRLSVDPSLSGEIGSGAAEKIRYNTIAHGFFLGASAAGIPLENLDFRPNIVTELETRGDIDHVLILPFGLEAVGEVPPNIREYAIEALDQESKVLMQGRIRSPVPLERGKKVEVKGFLCFNSPGDIGRISRFMVVKKPDEQFLEFQRRLRKSLDSGAADDLVTLAKNMEAGWSKHFLETCDKALQKAKPTTRVGIARALRETLKVNIDQEAFALLEKLVLDEDTSVARAAIRVGDGLKPCPQQVIQKVMRAASTRKDDARGDAMAFIRGLDPAVPENIEMFLRESENTDHGIRCIAATFLAKANLEGSRNLELGARFVQDDQEEVVLAGAKMIGKQAKADRAKAMALSIPLLGNRFDSCRAMADEIFREMEPFGQPDLTTLAGGLEERAPLTKCRIMEILSAMKSDARSLASAVAKGLTDEAEQVRARSAVCIAAIQADYRMVQRPLVEAATLEKVPAVRVEAIRTLSMIGRDAQVVGILFDGLANPEQTVVNASLTGFSNLKPPLGKDDLPVISPRLSSQVLPVRRQAYLALESTGTAGVTQAKEVALGLTDQDPSIVLSSLKCAGQYPEKIENGQKTVEKILDQRFADAKDERHAVACLEYLTHFGPKAATAIPVLRRIVKNADHNAKTVPLLKLVQSIGKDCHVMVPELTKLATNPQVQGFVKNRQDAKKLANIILKTNNNLALRDALASTGTSGAKALGKNLFDPDPVVKVFSLLSLENMGKDAQTVMPLIFRLTVQENAKNAAVWFQAQLTYGKLQEGGQVAANNTEEKP